MINFLHSRNNEHAKFLLISSIKKAGKNSRIRTKVQSWLMQERKVVYFSNSALILWINKPTKYIRNFMFAYYFNFPKHLNKESGNVCYVYVYRCVCMCVVSLMIDHMVRLWEEEEAAGRGKGAAPRASKDWTRRRPCILADSVLPGTSEFLLQLTIEDN